MIKNRVKKDKKKELIKELSGYAKNVLFSFLAGAIFTILLSFHARSEMIKNLYVDKAERLKIEQKIAQKIISHSDLITTISDKNYSICMQIGALYESAGDYHNAEYAYYLATQKAPQNNYSSFYKLAITLINLNKNDEAEQLIESVPDTSSVKLIKFKTRAYMVLGDKYFSVGKFLKAAGLYEKSNYYYSRLKKSDKIVKKSIEDRLINAYIEAANVIIKNGYNSDAVRFLKKALKYAPDNNKIKYRLAIVYSDLDPLLSIEYFDNLMKKVPQDVNFEAYSKALMKAANIEDIQGNAIKAKYYRYKVRSLDLFINNKVIYKDDIDITINNMIIKKSFFKYKIYADFKIQNNSASDIYKMTAEFVLRKNDNISETIQTICANKNHPIHSNGGETDTVHVKLGKNIFTKKELEHYYLDVYLFKDPKFKTLVSTYRMPLNN